MPRAADGIRTHDVLHGKREGEEPEKPPEPSTEAENGASDPPDKPAK
jgi:hypothetical protein